MVNAAMEPGRDDREETRTYWLRRAGQLAAMEPGRDDREEPHAGVVRRQERVSRRNGARSR